MYNIVMPCEILNIKHKYRIYIICIVYREKIGIIFKMYTNFVVHYRAKSRGVSGVNMF